ncbi:uncharacterized protein YjbJ (UPF0337 family) [Catenulispora sp. GAS73]|uniref:CsbD family protein n=1 Tax=Catenulispora sp. GAS73 TaxID=3156269 RepID=UPI0035129D84
MSINGKIEHTVQRMKGHAEEGAGKALGDDDLVAHGKADQIAAHAKQAASQAGDAARHVGQRFTKRAMRRLGRLHERLHEAADEAAREAREMPKAQGTQARQDADKR